MANDSLTFGISFALYKFLPWEDTRKKILGNEKLLNTVLKLLKSNNSRVVFIVMNVLEIVQLFEPEYSEKVKKKKFKVYNKEFLKMVDMKGGEYEEDN